MRRLSKSPALAQHAVVYPTVVAIVKRVLEAALG
jgi:hypothetical protein